LSIAPFGELYANPNKSRKNKKGNTSIFNRNAPNYGINFLKPILNKNLSNLINSAIGFEAYKDEFYNKTSFLILYLKYT